MDNATFYLNILSEEHGTRGSFSCSWLLIARLPSHDMGAKKVGLLRGGAGGEGGRGLTENGGGNAQSKMCSL